MSRDWRISSFTSLTANQGEELPDHNALGAETRGDLPASGIFAFPRGVKPGTTCLHKILEKLDFTQWNQPAAAALVREQLHVHGLPVAEFTNTLVEMLGKVMTAPLDPAIPGLTLAKITATQRLHELEFYFPLRRISPEMLRPLLQGAHPDHATGVRPSSGAATSANSGGSGFPPSRAGSPSPPVQGMLKGFIDLVFEFDGRYYLVDWKSNWLGNRVEDYGPAVLADEFRRRHYYFQCTSAGWNAAWMEASVSGVSLGRGTQAANATGGRKQAATGILEGTALPADIAGENFQSFTALTAGSVSEAISRRTSTP